MSSKKSNVQYTERDVSWFINISQENIAVSLIYEEKGNTFNLGQILTVTSWASRKNNKEKAYEGTGLRFVTKTNLPTGVQEIGTEVPINRINIEMCCSELKFQLKRVDLTLTKVGATVASKFLFTFLFFNTLMN